MNSHSLRVLREELKRMWHSASRQTLNFVAEELAQFLNPQDAASEGPDDGSTWYAVCSMASMSFWGLEVCPSFQKIFRRCEQNQIL